MSEIITDKNIETIKKSVVNESQEAFIKDAFDQLRKLSKTVDYNSIIPANNNVLIRCKLSHSIIATPSAPKAGQYTELTLDKISPKVKEETDFESHIGDNCFVNLAVPLSMGQGPCYIKPHPEDKYSEYHYFKIPAGQVEYFYKKKEE